MSRDGPVPIKAEGVAATPFYLFHVFQFGGVALSFEVRAFASDPEAIAHAEQVLQEHLSAAEVEIWDEARLVHKATRAPALQDIHPAPGLLDHGMASPRS